MQLAHVYYEYAGAYKLENCLMLSDRLEEYLSDSHLSYPDIDLFVYLKIDLRIDFQSIIRQTRIQIM